MDTNGRFQLLVKSQKLGQNKRGQNEWIPVYTKVPFVAAQTAIIVCDMWDNHWSKGATERVTKMAPRVNDFIRRARSKHVHIIHSPSDTMVFYEGSPARTRIKDVPMVSTPSVLSEVDIPLPIDDSDGGSDTGEQTVIRVWASQHPSIEIDQGRDVISDDEKEIYSFITHHSIKNVLVLGVHTNMCILNRPFGIKKLTSWQIHTTLIRDLTDAMYNPAKPPYVSHDQGTQLVIEYIEKFWCPTADSRSLPW
ncbi:hypothetical protein NZD89_15645 [Alicyclobacillus fastidiosus]|uniref:Isochorismatase n=1 Tax=Alicyclobacillus fastidiosus TaxID=392011 RepID=A0ABY6ZCJ1_9BACL|nr:hypothetical protein [Alicyclobacillus fastidiosus]WAH39836.1 hypothetical protein NZD89_15645 [Alicyclobacillus fastidiosus]GMA61092.1 hypothetical protein GCM10025859_15320 [Alicyclobacillus fastidiosus]